MDAPTVQKIAEIMCQKVLQTLTVKNSHYASGSDKLWNFKTQAKFEGRRSTEVCQSHMGKQFTTMLKASRDPMPLTFGTATEEGILQKPIDLMVYAILWVCNEMDEQGKTFEEVFSECQK